MLGDVKTSVSDGLLGFETDKGTGIFAAIGVSSVKSETPIVITGNMSAEKIKERLGLSPLADSVMDSVENGANSIYSIPVLASTDGIIGGIKKTKQGNGDVTVSGKPNNAYSVTIKVTGKGAFNSALFTYSIDGGYSFSDDVTIPLTGSYEIPDTGLTANFTEAAEEKESSFQVGDIYSFSTTAPQMTNADALAAIEKLYHLNEPYEFVHIIGESEPAMWVAVSSAQKKLEEEYHKPLLFVLEAYNINEGEKIEDYATRLAGDRKNVKNRNIQVVAARSVYLKMDGRTLEQNNAGVVCGLYAKTDVQKSIGRIREAYGMGISKDKMLNLTPAGINDYIELLDTAKYLTFRSYDGIENYYFVSNACVMSADGSDYRYAEDVRVLNKIIREVRKAALPLLQEDIDSTDTQSELQRMAKFMEEPLDKMIVNNEISSAEISVPDNQDILKTDMMQVVIRYAARGYIRSIEIDIGRTNTTVTAS
ncbi:MAG: DUF2586 domain-containing protein [Hungatella sp.]|jgi:hypothetical protein|nr:DUF2586 domain-containing protein [Hungatella sp.]